MNRIFVTYLANDLFLDGILVLKESLTLHNPNINITCMVTKDVSLVTKNILKNNKIILHQVDWIKSSRDDYKGRYKDLNKYMFTKLNLFLLPYDKVLYLDADIIVNKNIEHLFNLETPAAVFDLSAFDKDNIGYNAGVMLITPSKEIYDKLINCINEYGGNTDQTLLNKVLRFKKIPPEYNTLYKPMTKRDLWLAYFSPPAIIHFNSRKPWIKSGSMGWVNKWFDGCYYQYKKYRKKLIINDA